MSVSQTYVLSTRALPASLIGEAAEKGITIDVVSFISTKPLEDEASDDRLQMLRGRSLTAVFTSTNAVTAIRGEDRPDWKIFCISGATRRAAAGRFGGKSIAGTAHSAKELADIIIAQGAGGELYFFCGDRRREELPESLRAAGWVVHEVVVYRTALTPQKIGKPYDAIAFFSPSAVESFFSVNTVGPGTSLFAIGETTAAALRLRSANPVFVGEQPHEEILIRKIITNIQH